MSQTRKQIQRRRKIALDVLRKFQKMDELPDGYAFYYPSSKVWAARLTEFASNWQKRRPVFNTALTFDPGGELITLRITGPTGTKEFLDDTLSSVKRRPAFIARTAQLGFRLLTNPLRVMPDFLIIGAAKSGTTSLYAYLNQHPCVAPALTKEVYFFDRHFKRGFSWYRAQFHTIIEKSRAQRARNQAFITGEATPCYLFHPHAPKRVFESIPNVKLIVLLRNPVDRAYSFYNMQLRQGHETLSFEKAIEEEETRLDGELDKMLANEDYHSYNRQHFSYLSRGIYVEQLENWLRFFSREQILILKTEDFHKETSKVFRRTLDFLGLPTWELDTYTRFNDVPYRKMNSATRKRLIAYFMPHNQQLYEVLGVDLGWDR